MALIYAGTILTPPKLELVAQWLPSRPWAAGRDVTAVEQIGTYRFDDPGGKVGIDTMLLRTVDGRLLQVPATYREAPVDGAEDNLIGTMHHSVLGMRWIYDGCADPVWVSAMARAILTGGGEAALDVESSDGSHEMRTAATNVRGSGSAAEAPTFDAVSYADDASGTTISAGALRIVLRRALDEPFSADGGQTLAGTWPGNESATVLAALHGA